MFTDVVVLQTDSATTSFMQNIYPSFDPTTMTSLALLTETKAIMALATLDSQYGLYVL